LCKEVFHTTPDDPRITEMDSVQRLWMFNHWIGDQVDDAELAKNHAYLLASFDHPEEVKKLIGDGDVHFSTDEEFEEASRKVRDTNLKALSDKNNETRKGHRQRRLNLQPTPQK
jgi:hypothetical protein